MRIVVELSDEDVKYIIKVYEESLEGNRDVNDRVRAYHNGTLHGFDVLINTLGIDIPGLTDKYKGNLGFERRDEE